MREVFCRVRQAQRNPPKWADSGGKAPADENEALIVELPRVGSPSRSAFGDLTQTDRNRRLRAIASLNLIGLEKMYLVARVYSAGMDS